MRNETLPDLDALRIRLQIIFAVGQREPALTQPRDRTAGILCIHPCSEIEQHTDSQAVQAREFGLHVPHALHSGYAVQFRLDRLDATLRDGRRVHARGVRIADLLIDRRALIADHRRALQHVEQHLFIVVTQFREAAPAGAIGGQRMRRNPITACILVEIDARVHGFVQRRGVEPGGRLLLREGADREEGNAYSK